MKSAWWIDENEWAIEHTQPELQQPPKPKRGFTVILVAGAVTLSLLLLWAGLAYALSQATLNGTTFSEQAPTNKAQAVAAREMFTYSTSTSGAKLHTAMRSSSSENGARSRSGK